MPISVVYAFCVAGFLRAVIVSFFRAVTVTCPNRSLAADNRVLFLQTHRHLLQTSHRTFRDALRFRIDLIFPPYRNTNNLKFAFRNRRLPSKFLPRALRRRCLQAHTRVQSGFHREQS